MHNYFDSLFQIFFSSYFSSWGASSHSLYLLSLPLGGSLKIFFFLLHIYLQQESCDEGTCLLDCESLFRTAWVLLQTFLELE